MDLNLSSFNSAQTENLREVQKLQLDFVVLIPALNEADGIGGVIDEINHRLMGRHYGIIVVDGNSTDDTAKIAGSRGAFVIYQKGTGYGDALRYGLIYVRRYLNAKVIVMMDADMTYDHNDIPKLVDPILADRADMVIGERLNGLQTGAMTRTNQIGNKLISWFARRTLRVNIHDTQCGIRAFRTDLVDDLSLSEEGMPFALEMIADAKAARAAIKEAPITYRTRAGTTKLSPFKDGLRILGTLLRLVRDTEPMLFFVGTAGVLATIALALGSQVLAEWIMTGTVHRLGTAILSVGLLFGSLQFFTLGLVADMIKRSKRHHRI